MTAAQNKWDRQGRVRQRGSKGREATRRRCFGSGMRSCTAPNRCQTQLRASGNGAGDAGRRDPPESVGDRPRNAAQPDSNSNAGGGITGSPRTREESPPRAEEVVDDVAWNRRSLRVLDDREVLQYARLTAISLDEVFGGTVIHEWPGETWLGVLRGVC